MFSEEAAVRHETPRFIAFGRRRVVHPLGTEHKADKCEMRAASSLKTHNLQYNSSRPTQLAFSVQAIAKHTRGFCWHNHKKVSIFHDYTFNMTMNHQSIIIIVKFYSILML